MDSRYSWFRLFISLIICTIGSVGMWAVIVALPAVQAEFGVARASASLPYTLTMIGFGVGGVMMGRLADRFDIRVPLTIAAVALGVGFFAASSARNLMEFTLAHGLLIGLLGSSAVFGPMIADISHWFRRRRGIAVAVCASGNYMAGAVWPPIIQHYIATEGWRTTYLGIGFFSVVTILPLMLLLGRRRPNAASEASELTANITQPVFGLQPNTFQALLIVAGIACCVAMSMPQVHIVSLCADLGYGVARGAEMLSLMLAFGVVSRLLFGFISDRIGGLRALFIGSILQGIALLLYLRSDGLTSLYLVSALFGLFQGGIVPSYAIIIREHFPASEAGTRIGLVLMATLGGMAFGGWLSGAIFDLTGSYQAAFLNGVLWNVLNLSIVFWLLNRRWRRRRAAPSQDSGGPHSGNLAHGASLASTS